MTFYSILIWSPDEVKRCIKKKVRARGQKKRRNVRKQKTKPEDEKKFLQKNGFDPEQVKDAIMQIHKNRISALAGVLKDQDEKLD